MNKEQIRGREVLDSEFFAKGGMISVEYYSSAHEFEVGEIESFKTEKEAIAEAKKVFDAKDYPYIEVVASNGELIKSFGKRNFAKGGENYRKIEIQL